MRLRVRSPGLEDAVTEVVPGDVVSVETGPGKGVVITVRVDGTLHIDVDTTSGPERCLQVVPD